MPNSEDSHNNFKDLYNNQKVMYSNGGKDCVIVVEAVCKATDCLGLNKAAGCDGLTVEHIIYSHESIVIIESTLFTIMLRTGLVPLTRTKTPTVSSFTHCFNIDNTVISTV